MDLLPNENQVLAKIYLIRDQKVMIDEDLAELYQVETKRLNEQVKRNRVRFPKDFMFQLSEEEFLDLKSHFATSRWGGRRTLPYVFTEHGVLMLSSVLNNPTAIQVNIQIMRVYTKMREMILSQKNILLKLESLEKNLINNNLVLSKQDHDIGLIFETLKRLINPAIPQRNKIGYK